MARHAQATQVLLELKCVNGHTVVRVRDDGLGISPTSLSSSNGIREPAMLIGATLAIDSPPGAGTEVRLTIPPER